MRCAARAHRPALSRALRRRRRAGAHRRDDGLVGRRSCWLSSPLFDAGDRVALPRPAIPATATSWRRSASTPVDPRDRADDALDADRRGTSSARSAETPLDGLAHRQPRQSDRHHDRARARWPSSPQPAAQLGIWFISDEIYHGLTYDAARRDSACAFATTPSSSTASRNTSRMTGWRIGWMVRARSASCAPIERLAQNLYISPPPSAAGRGARRLRRRRRARSQQARLRREPRAAAARAAQSRFRQDRACRRRLLSLRRRQRFYRRRLSFAREMLEEAHRRRDARRRLR